MTYGSSVLRLWLEQNDIDSQERTERRRLVEDMLEVYNPDAEADSFWQRPKVEGSLNLEDYPHLTALPPNLVISENLRLYGCDTIPRLPKGLMVQGNMDVIHCNNVTFLPEGLFVGGSLNLQFCSILPNLPQRALVGGDFVLIACPEILRLPEEFQVRGQLILWSCARLKKLPEALSVAQNLHIDTCPQLSSLPEGLSIKGDLNLFDCDALESLPDRLGVQGSLNIYRCPKLRRLPLRLSLGQNMAVVDCPNFGIRSRKIAALGPTVDNAKRIIELINTGLSRQDRARLRAQGASDIRFKFYRDGLWDRHIQKDETPFERLEKHDWPLGAQEDALMCPLTLEPEHKLIQPVYLGRPTQARVYEYSELLTWWLAHGQEPLTRGEFELDELWRTTGIKQVQNNGSRLSRRKERIS